MANALQIAVVLVLAGASALLVRRSALLTAAALAMISGLGQSLRYATLLAYARAGGRNADDVWSLPLRGVRWLALAALLLALLRRRWSQATPRANALALSAALVVGAAPWGLDRVEWIAAQANAGVRADLQPLSATGAPRVSRLASTRAEPRWVASPDGAAPARFAIGLAPGADGYARAWACGAVAAGIRCWRPEDPAARMRELVDRVAAGDVAVGLGRVCATIRGAEPACWDWGGRARSAPALPEAIALGTSLEGFTCLRDRAGAVSCWDQAPALGWMSAASRRPVVLPVATAGAFAVGFRRGVCLEAAPQGVWCWDRERVAPADDATSIGAAGPVPLPRGVTQMAAAENVVCAVTGAGALACLDFAGRPTAPLGATRDVVQVAVAYDHGCARRQHGRVTCWGDDAWGQSATGDVDDATWVAVSEGVTCIARARGVECLGRARRK